MLQQLTADSCLAAGYLSHSSGVYNVVLAVFVVYILLRVLMASIAAAKTASS